MGQTLGRGMNLAAFRKTKTIEFPEYEGLAVILREISQGQMRNIETDVTKQLSLMIVDAEGQRIYETEEDMKLLGEMPWSMTDRLVKEAAMLNGFSKAAVDEVVKNLQASQSADSASA